MVERVHGSFRDPSGFVFKQDGRLYRQVNSVYRDDYRACVDSGLYKTLIDKGWLVNHLESTIAPTGENGFLVLEPEMVPFISYPYEWSFTQYQDAALLTLAIQERAIRSGMSLKDASAYNIQFLNGRPILIDTLSFEPLRVNEPWVAYWQFCQHFLAPLALMARRDIRLGGLMRNYIDGVPLDLAARLMPRATVFDFGLLMHLHLHALSQKKFGGSGSGARSRGGVSQASLLGMIDNLKRSVRKLAWRPAGTEWGEYYSSTNYSSDAMACKRTAIAELLALVQPNMVWDLGANTGQFSRVASGQGIPTIAFDIDPAAVEKNYLEVRRDKEEHLLPLVLDLTNPSPDIGWNNTERDSLSSRGPVDCVLALALIHHICIANNVPLDSFAAFLNRMGRWIILEFVPKEDSQVQRMLSTRKDIFPDYTEAGFERAFAQRFQTVRKCRVEGSARTVYLLKAAG